MLQVRCTQHENGRSFIRILIRAEHVKWLVGAVNDDVGIFIKDSDELPKGVWNGMEEGCTEK